MRFFSSLLSLTILISLSSQLLAEVDQFNVFRWNYGNPAAAQRDTKPWFEWWYYKITIPETREAYYFVYGIVNPWDKTMTVPASRAYVSFGNFSAGEQFDQRYGVKDFYASSKETLVKIGSHNQATDTRFFGAINTGTSSGEVSWDINIKKIWAYNATSWATGKGITNIEWYPAQADARCSGNIKLQDGRLVNFKDAPCYQDRNWGRTFPEWWTWIVSNHFEKSPGTALAIGGGKPTYLGVPFPYSGVSIGLRYKGKEIAFRPNDLNPVLIDIYFGNWYAKAMNDKYLIEVRALAAKDDFLDLEFMTPAGDIFHDFEALMGTLEVKLFKRPSRLSLAWELVDTLYSDFGGIEFGSRNIDSLDDYQNSSQNLYRSGNAAQLP